MPSQQEKLQRAQDRLDRRYNPTLWQALQRRLQLKDNPRALAASALESMAGRRVAR